MTPKTISNLFAKSKAIFSSAKAAAGATATGFFLLASRAMCSTAACNAADDNTAGAYFIGAVAGGVLGGVVDFAIDSMFNDPESEVEVGRMFALIIGGALVGVHMASKLSMG